MRFIEFMPLDGDDEWDRSRVLTAQEMLDTISAVYPLERISAPGSSDPATLYRFVDGQGTLGIIPTVTEPFCGTCNRIRLTADGKLRHCLFAVDETDLKTPMRARPSGSRWVRPRSGMGGCYALRGYPPICDMLRRGRMNAG